MMLVVTLLVCLFLWAVGYRKMQREGRLIMRTKLDPLDGLRDLLRLVFLYAPVLLMPLFSFNDSIVRDLSAEGLHAATAIARWPTTRRC